MNAIHVDDVAKRNVLSDDEANMQGDGTFEVLTSVAQALAKTKRTTKFRQEYVVGDKRFELLTSSM